METVIEFDILNFFFEIKNYYIYLRNNLNNNPLTETIEWLAARRNKIAAAM